MSTNYGWEAELASLSALSDTEAAAAINAITITPASIPVFGSFRTLAALLTADEYNTLRGALTAAAATEASAGGTLLNDMIGMLKTPGDEKGNNGGLDLTATGFTGMLSQLCTAANIPAVATKVANYTAGFQMRPSPKYPHAAVSEVTLVRSQL